MSNTLDSINIFRVLSKDLANFSMKDKIRGHYLEQSLDIRRILLTESTRMGLVSALV